MSNKSTPQSKPANKRTLSSPVEQTDLKKAKSYSDAVTSIPEESDMSENVTQISLSGEDIALISKTLQNTFESQLSTMVTNIVEGVVSGLNLKIAELSEENCRLRARVEALELKADRAEQYSRRNCLRLSGVPEVADECVDDKVLEVASAIGVNLTLEDIDRSHRLGKPRHVASGNRSQTKPRDIIIKFCSYRSRQKMLKNKSEMKNSPFKGSFLNENLSTVRDNLFYQARQLAKNRSIHSTWTFDGTILVKDKHSKIHRVETQLDLDQLKAKLQL